MVNTCIFPFYIQGSFCFINLSPLQAGHDFPTIFWLAVGGSLLSYIYSAPPLKVVFFLPLINLLQVERNLLKPWPRLKMLLQLKQNGWIGNFALGASYISLPWCNFPLKFSLINFVDNFWTMSKGLHQHDLAYLLKCFYSDSPSRTILLSVLISFFY